jgi:predicted RND superfamily exporter protein
LARAVLFSGLTTGVAFGSLALSSHPGTAGMGALLALMLFYTLLCTLLVLPALLGPVPSGEAKTRPGTARPDDRA